MCAIRWAPPHLLPLTVIRLLASGGYTNILGAPFHLILLSNLHWFSIISNEIPSASLAMKATWKGSERRPLRVEKTSNGLTLCFRSGLSCRFESCLLRERFTERTPPTSKTLNNRATVFMSASQLTRADERCVFRSNRFDRVECPRRERFGLQQTSRLSLR